MTSPAEHKQKIAVKVRYTPEEFIRLKKAFAKTTCRTIASYVRRLSLEQPVEITHRNASFDDFVSEAIRLREEMLAIRQLTVWTPDQLGRLIDLGSEIQSSIDKIARLCMSA
jgi:hypothetical protein